MGDKQYEEYLKYKEEVDSLCYLINQIYDMELSPEECIEKIKAKNNGVLSLETIDSYAELLDLFRMMFTLPANKGS